MPGPLDGIRVLDFTIAQQGAYATLLMADLGAEVIKVEPPGRGEVGRILGIDRKTGFSAYFLAINRGKKSLTLDLKAPQGREVALRLARDCDVVVHNFRPGVMEKLGLGYEAFRAVNPRIIHAAASAFGTNGTLGRKPGNDILAQAMSGLMSVTGEGEAPLPAGAALADHIGALTLGFGIVSALLCRERTGVGQQVETSLLGSLLAAQSWELTHYMLSGELPAKAGRGHTHLPLLWYTYRTRDGWMALGGVDPSRWAAFCRAIGRPELETDERFDSVGKRIRRRSALNEELDRHFAAADTSDWIAALEAADIFCAPVLDYARVAADAGVLANGYLTATRHPRLGDARVVACPIAFSDTPADSSRPEPLLGEHTQDVLREFGYTEGAVAELRGAGIV
ncbi:MAG: CoA transferase [Dehalococcoidia bacterium]|nr:CoA transferase [Dehalococcoidia bacterium]